MDSELCWDRPHVLVDNNGRNILNSRALIEDVDPLQEVFFSKSLSTSKSALMVRITVEVVAAKASFAKVTISPVFLSPLAVSWERNDFSDTAAVVNKKKRRQDAAQPSRLYRVSQMLIDFQKSIERSVSRSPAALCLSDARLFNPATSTKSRSSSFSISTAVSSGSLSS